MKTKITKLAIASLVFFLVGFYSRGYAQPCTGNHVTVSMQNVTQPTSTTVEFDIYIKNDGTTSLNLASLPGGLTYNVGLVPTGATMSGIVITQPSATGNFPSFTNLSNITHTLATRQIRWSNNPPMTVATAVSLPLNVDLKFARIRLTSTLPWTQNFGLNLIFNQGLPVAQYSNVVPLVYCNGNTNSTVLSGTSLSTVNPSTVCLSCGPIICPASASASNLVNPTCSGLMGSADITLDYSGAIPPPVNGTFIIDGSTNGTFSSNPFTVSGLTQGQHTISVTSDSACLPNDVIVNIGSPTSPNYVTDSVSACDSYAWNGQVYTSSGTYTGTTSNCITELLYLEITPTLFTTDTVTSCNAYTWNG